MGRLVKEYYRAQEVAKDLETRSKSLFKELADLRLDGNRLAKEAHELQGLSLDSALSTTARDEKKRCFELKLSDLRALEVRYDEAKVQRETELQNHAVQANKRIFEEILTVTRGVGEREGFNLILNASKASPATSDVLFSKNVDDLTGKVLASLNSTKSILPTGSNSEQEKQR